MAYDLEMILAEIKLLHKEYQITKYGYDSIKFLVEKNIEQSSITVVGKLSEQLSDLNGQTRLVKFKVSKHKPKFDLD